MDLIDIYNSSYHVKRFNEQENYYLISVRPINEKEYFISFCTQWVGWEKNYEVRQADIVNPITVNQHFKVLGYPLAIVDSINSLTSLLKIGGHALINKVLVQSNWNEMLLPKVVVGSQYEGFLDYDTIIDKHKQRFARGTYRMEIFERDNFRCRVCGSSPDDDVHIRLQVHHIKPWEEGGLSMPENLITLCSTCHDGIKIVDREILYEKIGIVFPNKNHLLYPQKPFWNNEQIRRFVYLVSNSLTMRIKGTSNKGIYKTGHDVTPSVTNC